MVGETSETSYEYLNAETKQQQKAIQKKYGLRYSALIELPYFDPIRHTVIDPMHNLFLGTAKHCLDFSLASQTLPAPMILGWTE